MTHARAIKLLEAAAAELARINRAKEYGFWRDRALWELDEALAVTDPFRPYANAWLHTGDGSGRVIQGCFGAWAINLLLANFTPSEILENLEAQVESNEAAYEESSPILGLTIDLECVLATGVILRPRAPADGLPLDYRLLPSGPFGMYGSRWSCTLSQSFLVKPAFEARASIDQEPSGSVTAPTLEERDKVRRAVRFACLLASTGAVAMPSSKVSAANTQLFASGEMERGSINSRTPFHSVAAEVTVIKAKFDALAAFSEGHILGRAIERLGRSRLASSDVDKALELGMAAEIALMHGEKGSAEITNKLGSRAAWLLGKNSAERSKILGEMKLLYQARSQAVHTGILSAKSKLDLAAGDALVSQALSAILNRGRFPDWTSLTMGGD